MTPPESRLLIETAKAVAEMLKYVKDDNAFSLKLVETNSRLNAAIQYYEDFSKSSAK